MAPASTALDFISLAFIHQSEWVRVKCPGTNRLAQSQSEQHLSRWLKKSVFGVICQEFRHNSTDAILGFDRWHIKGRTWFYDSEQVKGAHRMV